MFDFTKEQLEWRDAVRDFIAGLDPGSRAENVHVASELKGDNTWLAQLRRKGWLGIGWPREYGGLGKSIVEQWILIDELTAAGLPRLGDGVNMIGPAIIEVASEQMKRDWLPRILSGEVEFALGYSEPEAGTDLARLRTRAVPDGDEFVINGQKTWNSSGHFATHEWLAVRTDPDAPAREGISILIVPIDSPGITVSPIWTWGGARTNDVFFDNVRVPRANLVGELNKGWSYVMTALNLERFAIGGVGELRAQLPVLVRFLASTFRGGRTLWDDPRVRERIADLASRLHAARLLSLRNVRLIDRGEVSAAESSMVKVWASELRMEFADTVTEILGAAGQLTAGDRRAPLRGEYEHLYRKASHYRFTGGTNEIQRDLIARRGLGLPRQSVGRRGSPTPKN
ncbi:acyl-CoA dehydrogenase [Amycolatopsis sp. K13G38]|uniref:Acyl-CoA dehydrogenase n=1 Tax=Amycolatopsis acididurans TaxID=2724524 RepID=A0ABX1J9X9_9PSEU|nr:acyl-CoA dehydrogenase family protein [Amycolatopsis acididurans]NKQ56096.1 acyl-CoA dehydrogenase [Amycolatopsis acididurans]